MFSQQSLSNPPARKRSLCDSEESTPRPVKRQHLEDCGASTSVEVKSHPYQTAIVSQLPSPQGTEIPGRAPSRTGLCTSPHPSTHARPLSSPDLDVDGNAVGPQGHGRIGTIDAWLSKAFEWTVETSYPDCDQHLIEDMPPLKRQASLDSIQPTSSFGDGLESLASTDAKSNFYSSSTFPVLLEQNGVYMYDSTEGLDEEEVRLCREMLNADSSHPPNPLLDASVFPLLSRLSHNKSEQWLVKNMHPHIFPSPELLVLCGQENFKGLIEGCDDGWIRMPFPSWGKCPQPDCTVAFTWDNFTKEELRKLGIVIGAPSQYMARDDMFFPFITREAKCDKQPLEIATRQNLYSMSVALDGIIELFRKINRLEELNGKALGLSMSYDNDVVKMFAHYVVTDAQKPTDRSASMTWSTKKYLAQIGQVSMCQDNAKDRWKPYNFFYNACLQFSQRHLTRIKDAISFLPQPDLSLQSGAVIDEPDSQGSDIVFKKPRNGTITAELRKQNEMLQDQLRRLQDHLRRQEEQIEQLRQDSKQQLEQLRQDSKQQLEVQREDSKQQLEVQREDSKQQMEQQRQQMEQQLKQQSEIISLLKTKNNRDV